MLFSRKPRTVLVRIEGRVEWKIAQDPASGTYIGVCPALRLNAIGDSWTEFWEAANETTGLLFLSLLKAGEMDGFLHEHGFRLGSPLPTAGERPHFDMPFGVSWANSPGELVATA